MLFFNQRALVVLVGTIAVMPWSAGRAQTSESLKLTATIALPGVKGRFDHFAIDEKRQRLFVAALGNDTLEVIDVAAAKRLKSIAGLHKPTGVLYLPDRDQIAVANGEEGTLKVFNGSSYALLKTITSLPDADNVRFDEKTKTIYIGFGDGGLAIGDAAAIRRTGSITLAAHPESFQLEQQGSRIFVNVPEMKQIAVVDRRKRTVSATWPMQKYEANFPMALDEANHRLFVGCRRPARLVVFNTAAGSPATDLEISGDTDDLFYDSALRRIYVSCGEGFIDVVDQIDSDHYQRRERIPTRTGARTSLFSAARNELYVAVPQHGGEDAEIRVYQPQK